ncbi:MAG: Endonuclease [Patescibacteria group bacterium]|nr:Endonuclease [Patescibacteria group bacterium]
MQNIKLVSLNTAANRFAGIDSFFEKMKGKVDIFCLQEVLSTFQNPNYPKTLHRTEPFYRNQNLQINLPIITEILGKENKNDIFEKYMTYFSPHIDFLGTFAPEGNMMAMKYLSDAEGKPHRFDYGSFEIFSGYDRDTNVTLQWMFVGFDSDSIYLPKERSVCILNVHGLWNGQGKGDSDMRMHQSNRIVAALRYLNERFNCEFILAGDFNLAPDTKSVSIIEKFGLRNLITENGISSTRTRHYKKECKYADYMFVSSGITVNQFKVLRNVVSDHAPLYLDFSIL